MTRKMDPDLRQLRAAARAIEQTTPRMRRATLEFLWDKFVIDPLRKLARDADAGDKEGRDG